MRAFFRVRTSLVFTGMRNHTSRSSSTVESIALTSGLGCGSCTSPVLKKRKCSCVNRNASESNTLRFAGLGIPKQQPEHRMACQTVRSLLRRDGKSSAELQIRAGKKQCCGPMDAMTCGKSFNKASAIVPVRPDKGLSKTREYLYILRA
jgi:hypothetical protein